MSWQLEFPPARPGALVTAIEHFDGIPWYDAPIPRRWHRCKPQSRTCFDAGWAGRDAIERCACGAIRYQRGVWIRRNDRRRGR